VFASAREKARQTDCQSNLKQLGLAFLQYAEDYDGGFPAPVCTYSGALGPNTSYASWVITKASGGTLNGNLWTGGTLSEQDGIINYLKNRTFTGGESSVFTCPDAAVSAFPNTFVQADSAGIVTSVPDEAYIMNQELQYTYNDAGMIGNPALQGVHAGTSQAATYVKDADGGGSGYFAGGTAPAFNPDLCARPSQLILLYEGAQLKCNTAPAGSANRGYDSTVLRYGCPFVQPNYAVKGRLNAGTLTDIEASTDTTGSSSSYATYSPDGVPSCMPQDYHTGGSDFLFCDGHVKWYIPSQTWTPYANSLTENGPNSYHPNGVDFYTNVKHSGNGPTDLWYPFGNNVVYLDGNIYTDPGQTNPSGTSL